MDCRGMGGYGDGGGRTVGWDVGISGGGVAHAQEMEKAEW